MKKTLKPLGLAAIIAVIAFSLAACSDGGSSAAPTLTGITAAYTQTAAVYPDTPLDSLKAGLTVTAQYSDNTSKAVTNYSLSGTLTAGTSTITATYEGKTATFTVTVTGSTPVSADITYTAVQDGGEDGEADTTGIVFTFSESVDSLNLTAADIAVSGNAAKGADAELTGTGAQRTLAVTVSGAGQAVVQITKDGIEAETKNVTVYKAGEAAPTLTGITAVYTQTATVYPDTPLDDLKTELTVTARYSNGDEVELGASEYVLSGALTVGESEVTATYQGETDTFTVTVSAAPAAKTLTGITLNTGTVKKAYAQNETLNLANLTVTANYSDSTSAAVTGYTSDPEDGAALTTAGNITVTISYTEGGVTETDEFTVTVTHVHNYQWKVTTPATYISEGEETETCTGDPTHTRDKRPVARTPFTSVTELGTWLASQETNTTATPYTINLQTDDLTGIRDALGGATGTKYVYLDLTGSTLETIPENTFYGSAAPRGTAALAGVTIPDGVITIETRAFNSCTSLTSVSIPYGVTTIGLQAFTGPIGGSMSLTSVDIPNSVTTIGMGAFAYNPSLTSVTIPDSVTSIGSQAFWNCTNITSATIPASVTSLGTGNFNNATHLTINCNIPANFLNSTSLTTLTIGSGVTSIGEYAFNNALGDANRNLVSVTFADGSDIPEANFPKNAFPQPSGTFSEVDYLFYVYKASSPKAGTYTRSGTNSPWIKLPPVTVNVPALTFGAWVDGNIPINGRGQQWFKFTATVTGTQYIHASFGTLTTLFVQMYDSDGTALELSGTGLTGSTTYTDRTVTSGETYYIKVTPYSGLIGTYKIAFNQSTTAPAQ